MRNDKDLSDPDQLDERVIQYLSGDLKRIAEVAGIEAALKIAHAFRGAYIYISGLDKLMRLARDEKIRDEYDQGVSVRRLALKYQITERGIRKILGKPSSEIDIDLYALLRNYSA